MHKSQTIKYLQTLDLRQLLINNVNPTKGGEPKQYSFVTCSSPHFINTRKTVCWFVRSVFSLSRRGCCSSVLSHGCRAGPWCFAGWAPQYRAGASGRGPRSSRPPSAASIPHQKWATVRVWLLETTWTQVSPRTESHRIPKAPTDPQSECLRFAFKAGYSRLWV